jgi:Ca2+/Na+ antiporter
MLNADLIIGFFALALGGLVLSVTRGMSMLGGVFINYLLVAIFLLGIIMIIKGLTKPEKITFFESSKERKNILFGLFILFVYLVFMPRIGFLWATYVFYAVFSIFLAEDRWSARNLLESSGLSVVMVTFFYVVFHYVLAVPLPKGSWWQ